MRTNKSLNRWPKVNFYSTYAISILMGLSLIACNDVSLPSPQSAEEIGRFTNYEPVKDSSGKVLVNPITKEPIQAFPIEVTVDDVDYQVMWMSENWVTSGKPDGLFTYDEALKACPSGWQLPNDNHWRALLVASALKENPECLDQTDSNYLASNKSDRFPLDTLLGVCLADAGLWLKSAEGWSGFEGSNQYHFNGLPDGYIESTGEHLQKGEYAYFWSLDTIKTPVFFPNEKASSSWYFAKSNQVVHEENRQSLGFSVRCIKDETAK